MHRHFLTVTCAAFVACGALVVRAGDAAENRLDREQSENRKEDWKKLSPEEREAKLKEGRRTNAAPAREDREKRREQLKNMSPEERAAKRKEIKGRLEKRIAELRARRANATMTAQEARELERREQILKRFEAEAQAVSRGKVALTNSPAQH